MKAKVFMAALMVAALAGCAASGPPTAWGKPGVSRIDYGTDIGTCTGRAASASAGNGAHTAGGVQGSNGAAVMDRDRGGASVYRDPGKPMPAANAATSSQLPATGTYSGTASSDYAQRAATQQRAQEMAVRKLQADTFRSCLAERGYSEFELTPEQRAKLGSLKPGSNEYHEYLYSLGAATR
jgi:hypothetical protein